MIALRAMKVERTAIPIDDPRLRTMLNALEALPMSSRGTGAMVSVVSGMKSSPSAQPWMNCGQKKSQ